ncbi:MAG: hypothetical protein RLY86_1921 [Pseudomonadota bacterium]|jgi:hypothetical protein
MSTLSLFRTVCLRAPVTDSGVPKAVPTLPGRAIHPADLLKPARREEIAR